MLSLLFSLSLGERLLVVTPVAVFLSAVLIVAILYVDFRLQRKAWNDLSKLSARVPLPSLLTAIMYYEAGFITGYLRYWGAVNAVWLIGIPSIASVIACRSRPRQAIAIFFPVITMSFITTGMVAAVTGLPLPGD